jgi:hypothetical protein
MLDDTIAESTTFIVKYSGVGAGVTRSCSFIDIKVSFEDNAISYETQMLRRLLADIQKGR